MALRRPTPLGEKILEVSPEARAMRVAQRIADVAMPVSKKAISNSRRRSSPMDGNRLLPPTPEVIPSETINALGRHLRDKQPLFDKFTKGFRVKPNKENIEAYINGGVRKAGPKPDPAQTEILHGYYADRRRQALQVGDKLQREVFANRNTARLRRHALMTTRFLSSHDVPLDSAAATIATDAIVDFGHALNANVEDTLQPLHNEDLGYQIIVIGSVAEYDPTLLTDNPELLRLVQLEQKAREEYWGKLFDATVPVLGDRLTKQHHADQHSLDAELGRLAELRQT